MTAQREWCGPVPGRSTRPSRLTAPGSRDRMNAAQTTELTALVAVRVPDGDDGSLVESARNRLERPDAVEQVDVLSLEGIEPALAATVVELEVQVTLGKPTTSTTALETAPGTERVDHCQV